MNLFELFIKIGVDDQASGKVSALTEKLGNGLKTASKIGTSAIVALGTVAVKTFADYEQLIGGAELMFGDAFDTVMNNARNAYKTVQMSQNEYLQQVNGFATGLKTALGGNEQAAADLAHKIVQAEADIVAATGNTAENVQNAFNGIMKSNFTMLDNLQIGITPTKEGFQEVIDKVNEWNASMGNATDYQMGNLADMQSALVDYIDMVGMSGYAQEEASGTILGSFASMKAAASDFATSLIDENGDVGTSWDNLKETVGTFVDNLKPKIGEFLEAISPIATTVAGITGAFVAFKTAATISTLISTLVTSFQAYQKANEGATIAQWAMNAAINANPFVLVATLVAGLVAAIVTLWHTNEDFKNTLIGAWDEIKNTAVSVWESIAKFFTEDIPDAFNAVINFVNDNWQELLFFITKPIDGALKFLYSIIPDFSEWVDGVWNAIKNGFTKIINGAKTWGKDLIDNFIGGIRSKAQKLKNGISGVAQTVKDFIGFSEPKKGPLSNFHTYAPDMMDLFAKGIKENERTVVGQIKKSFDFRDMLTSTVALGANGEWKSSAYSTKIETPDQLTTGSYFRADGNQQLAVVHSGTIRVEGVNDRNELFAVTEYSIENALVALMRKQARLV